jgi:hypothetical protein
MRTETTTESTTGQVEPADKPPTPGKTRSLGEALAPSDMTLEELERLPIDPEAELIRHRFLCKAGSMLLVGPTGVGKSVLLMQLMYRWAVGMSFLGIEPARPLRSIIYNAENDTEDMQEMLRSCNGMRDFTDEMRLEAKRNIIVVNDRGLAGDGFIDDLRMRADKHRPDLVSIDPLLHYGGLDVLKQSEVSAFLRNKLGPVLEAGKFAAVLVCHTNKPRNNDRPVAPHEMAYSATGSAEWANYARCNLTLEPVDGQVFKLVAGKRGRRLRWKENGEPVVVQNIKWAKQDGCLLWEPATGEELAEAKANKRKTGRVPSWQEALGIFPDDAPLSTKEVQNAFVSNHWDRNSYKEVLEGLIKQGEIALVETRRSNAKKYARPPVAQGLQMQYDLEQEQRLVAAAQRKLMASQEAKRRCKKTETKQL